MRVCRAKSRIAFIWGFVISLLLILYTSPMPSFSAVQGLETWVAQEQNVPAVQQQNKPSPVKPASLPAEEKNSGDFIFGKGLIQITILFTFTFYLACITVNYGFRTYWNSPLHPSFMPFVYVAVASILAFTVVLTFDIAIGGTIDFEFLGQKFRGASGPIVLWILSFLAIITGFRLSGATDLAKSEVKANPASHHLLRDDAIANEKAQKAPPENKTQ